MLILRAAVGLVLIIDAMSLFANEGGVATPALATSFVAFGSGVCLLFGFLTPVASSIAAASCLTVAFASFAFPDASLSGMTAGLIVVIAISLALLGPGAFSVDSRLFGRREIVIPKSPRSPTK